jgi:hypothetical protein
MTKYTSYTGSVLPTYLTYLIASLSFLLIHISSLLPMPWHVFIYGQVTIANNFRVTLRAYLPLSFYVCLSVCLYICMYVCPSLHPTHSFIHVRVYYSILFFRILHRIRIILLPEKSNIKAYRRRCFILTCCPIICARPKSRGMAQTSCKFELGPLVLSDSEFDF